VAREYHAMMTCLLRSWKLRGQALNYGNGCSLCSMKAPWPSLGSLHSRARRCTSTKLSCPGGALKLRSEANFICKAEDCKRSINLCAPGC
jgi:hypothetical protein